MISFTYDFYWRIEQAKLDESVDLDASDEFAVCISKLLIF
jgi:hypothetical protein